MVAALVAAVGSSAAASPGVDVDDPSQVDLLGVSLPPHLGGVRPLTEARIRELRRAAGLPPDPRLVSDQRRRAWLAPLRRLRLRGDVARDRLRPYSNEEHPRDLAGGVAITCEHRQGRSCGDGAGLELELDSAAGYGPWLAAASRVRVGAGSGDRETDIQLDRAYGSAELGPVMMLAGRDVLVLGPSARTQALWGDNVAAIDQIRLSTSRPLAVGDGSILRVSALYFVGRMRDPQRFDGTLVDGTRLQLDLWQTLEMGATHLIQLGGDGAPDFSFGDYVLEHVQHNAESGEFANHRLSIDLAVTVPDAGLRLYYELAAEDMRDEIGTMLRRDADHVLGAEVDGVVPGVGLLAELTSTGVRSHEHQLFTTGTTSGGRVAGNPLGPGSLAVFVGARLDLAGMTVWPWIEVARQSNDIYAFGTGDIVRTDDLPEEWRTRGGARLSLDVARDVRLEVRALAERVTTADFVANRERWNAAAEVSATWTPRWRLAGRP